MPSPFGVAEGKKVFTSGEQAVANYVWDTNTLDWVPQIDVTIGSATANVTVQNPSLAVTQSGVWSVRKEIVPLLKRLDKPSPTVLYVGETATGTGDGSATWRIKRITLDVAGEVTAIEWANGGTANQVWANRTILSYS